jgi:hypothetical protein
MMFSLLEALHDPNRRKLNLVRILAFHKCFPSTRNSFWAFFGHTKLLEDFKRNIK